MTAQEARLAHAEHQVAMVQAALVNWRREPDKTLRHIAKIVGYYIPSEPEK